LSKQTPEYLSSSNTDSDAESASSTVVYDHEPFITFRSRVLAFAQSNIWTDATPEEITVERLQGGGFNRIVGLTRQLHGSSNTKIQYILRLPRFEAAQLDNDVAVLQFLHQLCEIPAPKVIMFDGTKDNGLDSQYMLQNRIPGTDLYSSYPNLTHDERCRVARELGSIFRQMLAAPEQCCWQTGASGW
jgi:hypothetical protein